MTFREALARQYTKLDFDGFCAAIGEPPKHGDTRNVYAEEKWSAFQTLARKAGELGPVLDRVLAPVVERSHVIIRVKDGVAEVDESTTGDAEVTIIDEDAEENERDYVLNYGP